MDNGTPLSSLELFENPAAEFEHGLLPGSSK